MPLSLRYKRHTLEEPVLEVSTTRFDPEDQYEPNQVAWYPMPEQEYELDGYFTLLLMDCQKKNKSSKSHNSYPLLWGVVNVLYNANTNLLNLHHSMAHRFVTYQAPTRPSTRYSCCLYRQPRGYFLHECLQMNQVSRESFDRDLFVQTYQLEWVDQYDFSVSQEQYSMSHRRNNDAQDVKTTTTQSQDAVQENKYTPLLMQYMVPRAPLSNQQGLDCLCWLHVAGEQPDWCIRERAWGQTRHGHTCLNPLQDCSMSKTKQKQTPRTCIRHFDLNTIPDHELRALAAWYKIPAIVPYDRDTQIATLNAFLCKKTGAAQYCSI